MTQLLQPVEPLLTGLPSSGERVDGQIINFVADSTSGVIWRFRYRAAGAANKQWEFIGGPPLAKGPSGSYTTSNQVAPNLITGGPTLVVPFAGDYLLGFSCKMEQLGAAGIDMAALVYAAGAPVSGVGLRLMGGTVASGTLYAAAGLAMQPVPVTLTSGATIDTRAIINNGSGSGLFTSAALTLLPIRVGP